jgi:hypothetical protein
MADMTPFEWRDLLAKRMDERWARMRVFDDYFEGRHPNAFATAQWREAFGSLLRELNDNWCQVVVTSAARRLKVQGFRFGSNRAADQDANAIWQANGLDAQSKMAQQEAIKLGEAGWLVEPPMDGRKYPRITWEHPSEFIVAHAPGDRRVRVAALKKWHDELDDYWYATLFLPGSIWKFRSERTNKDGKGPIKWGFRPGGGEFPNPLGVVPGVAIQNDPSLTGGRSDLASGIPIQDAVNKLCSDMIVASEYAAYPQRVITGAELPDDPVEAAKVKTGVQRIFTVEDPAARVFNLQAADLKNYVNAIEMFIQHFAAQTNTPPHYLLGNMVNISGDALAAAESGLVSKVDDKKDPFGEAHEDMMRLAFLSMGDLERANADDAETLWAPSERRSFAQVVDGAVKLAQIGFPPETVMEELGWSPQRAARVKEQMAANGQTMLLPPAAPPAPPAEPETSRPEPGA